VLLCSLINYLEHRTAYDHDDTTASWYILLRLKLLRHISFRMWVAKAHDILNVILDSAHHDEVPQWPMEATGTQLTYKKVQ